MSDTALTGQPMHIPVRLLGFLSLHAGASEVVVDVPPGASVADLLKRLAEQLGPAFHDVLQDYPGRLHGGIEVLLDGHQIPARQIERYVLHPHSRLTLIPLIGGG